MDTVGIMASCYLAFSKIPVIISERNDPSEKSRELSRGFKILRKISYYLAAGYVFQSNGAKEYYPIRCQNKSTVILNPIDVSSLPDRTDDRIEKKIVTVGRLHPQKNHKLLIKCFAKSNFCKYGYTLHIYGEGELRKELESLIYKLNVQDKVFLEGNHADVLNEIKNASLFVFTSNYEGLPNALMEAMALGIPVISTDCSPGGARMLIKDDESNGIIIPCNEEKKLIESLDYWFSHPRIMENAGLQARQIRDKINVQSVTLLWIEFIKKVISGVK